MPGTRLRLDRPGTREGREKRGTLAVHASMASLESEALCQAASAPPGHWRGPYFRSHFARNSVSGGRLQPLRPCFHLVAPHVTRTRASRRSLASRRRGTALLAWSYRPSPRGSVVFEYAMLGRSTRRPGRPPSSSSRRNHSNSGGKLSTFCSWRSPRLGFVRVRLDCPGLHQPSATPVRRGGTVIASGVAKSRWCGRSRLRVTGWSEGYATSRRTSTRSRSSLHNDFRRSLVTDRRALAGAMLESHWSS